MIDERTVRYTWSKPNPLFLPSLAGASPNYIFLPAHYMRQFHEKYADPAELEKAVKTRDMRDWVALHTQHRDLIHSGRLVHGDTWDATTDVRGVVEPIEAPEDEAVVGERMSLMLQSLVQALSALNAARREEGGRLKTVLHGQLDELARLRKDAASADATTD